MQTIEEKDEDDKIKKKMWENTIFQLLALVSSSHDSVYGRR